MGHTKQIPSISLCSLTKEWDPEKQENVKPPSSWSLWRLNWCFVPIVWFLNFVLCDRTAVEPCSKRLPDLIGTFWSQSRSKVPWIASALSGIVSFVKSALKQTINGSLCWHYFNMSDLKWQIKKNLFWVKVFLCFHVLAMKLCWCIRSA